MKKEELSKLRSLYATQSMVRALQMRGRENIDKYRYHLAARVQQLDALLKVSVCVREDIEKGVMTPKWDIFINYQGDEYITRERQEDGTYKWRTAMCWNLEEYYWRRDYEEYCYINAGGIREIKQILKTDSGGWVGLWQWQQGCKRRLEDRKVELISRKWDAEMQPVKEPPAGFEGWAKKNVFDGENYIFYKKAGEKTGYCTAHMGEVALKGTQQHNMDARCPVCRKKITYISRSKKKNPIWTYAKSATCLQKYKNGIVERTWTLRRVDKKTADGGNRSEYYFDERERMIILPNGIKKYRYEDYRRRGVRWQETPDNVIERYAENMYPRNIKAVINRIRTAYPIAVRHGYKAAGFAYYICQERKRPTIEMCYKAGLYNLGHDLVTSVWKTESLLVPIDESKGTLAKKLGIDDARLKRLRETNGDLEMLEWLQKEKKENTLYKDDDIKTLRKGNIGVKDYERRGATKYLSMAKICNYLRKQEEIRKQGIWNIWMDWNDYISMLEEMQVDCTKEILLKPKDLQIAHNEAVAAISMREQEGKIKRIEKKYRKAVKLLKSGELKKKYGYEDGQYCITVPTSIADIFREGTILKHCIHTCEIYFGRINERETYLVFLRKKDDPDKPWYTLEIEPGGNIRQKKSVLNESYKDLNDAIPFLQKWQKEVARRMTDEDRKLAQKSDKARQEGYKKLREEKKIVWHGSFQGQLLADALESDFMATV